MANGAHPLVQWMEDTGWTLDDLAENTGLSRRTITNARAGLGMTADTLRRLHDATGLPYEQLIGEGDA